MPFSTTALCYVPWIVWCLCSGMNCETYESCACTDSMRIALDHFLWLLCSELHEPNICVESLINQHGLLIATYVVMSAKHWEQTASCLQIHT